MNKGKSKSPARLRLAGSSTAKSELPSIKLIERKVRFTQGQLDRLADYRAMHDGKTEADAIRDLFNAGVRTLLPAKLAIAA
jgi:hypothetical protein